MSAQRVGARMRRSRIAAIAVVAAVAAAASLALPAGAAAATSEERIACQAAIESEGRAFLDVALAAVRGCAAGGADVASCLDAEPRRGRLARHAERWRKRARKACPAIASASELGYHGECAPAGSPCAFASVAVAARGVRNDVVDCLACRVQDALAGAARRLLPAGASGDACRAALGDVGLNLLESRVDEVADCLLAPSSISIAACLSEPDRRARLAAADAAWRAGAEAACAGRAPVDALGYPALCSGVPPTLPPSCSVDTPACTFRSTRLLSSPGDANDLVDCLACTVEEAALAIGRDLHGAEVCCNAGGCRTVRSRRSCFASGGRPVHYAMDWVYTDGTDQSHGIAIGHDDRLLVATAFGGLITRMPDGSLSGTGIPGSSFTVGIAADPHGHVFGALRHQNQVFERTAGGETFLAIGSGQPGHDGDGGPADAARLAAPNGVALDPWGNVFFTESGIVAAAFQPGAPLSGEHVRAVDAVGIIHTIAGSGPLGTAGAGSDALDAALSAPYSIARSPLGRLLVGEAIGQRLVEVDPGGRLHVRAGRVEGSFGAYSGDGGPATDARFSGIEGIAVDGEGKVALADFRNNRIRLVDPLGSVITIAGTGRESSGGAAGLVGPGARRNAGCTASLAVDSTGRFYFPELRADVVARLTRAEF